MNGSKKAADDAPISEPSVTPAELKSSAGIVAWALGAVTVVQLLARIFAKNAMGAAAVEALGAELLAGRAGVTWSDPSTDASDKTIALRALRGAGGGLVLAALAFGAAFAHRTQFSSGKLSIAAAAFGLFTAALAAVRDELLFRGFVLRAFRHVVPLPLLFAICAAVGVAARLGDPPATPVELASAAALAVVFAAAWIHDRGAWLAVGAHAGFTWATATLGRGVFFDVKPASGSGLEADLFVAVALGLVAIVAARFSARFSASRGSDGRISPSK